MRLIFILAILFIFSSCSTTIVLTSDLSDQQAYRLYKNSLKKKTELIVLPNADSSYVLLVQSAEPDSGDPCSFLIIDLNTRSLIYKSINRYRNVKWLDEQTIMMKKNIGNVKPNTDPGKANPNSFYDYFNVSTKEITTEK